MTCILICVEELNCVVTSKVFLSKESNLDIVNQIIWHYNLYAYRIGPR